MADVDNEGSVVCQVMKDLGPLKLKLQAHAPKKEWQTFEVDADYLGSDYSVGLKAMNLNPVNDTGIL